MLVLTRKPGERIVLDRGGIDGEIHIQVLGVRGGNVRIGIDAPPEIHIRREELLPLPFPPAAEAACEVTV